MRRRLFTFKDSSLCFEQPFSVFLLSYSVCCFLCEQIDGRPRCPATTLWWGPEPDWQQHSLAANGAGRVTFHWPEEWREEKKQRKEDRGMKTKKKGETEKEDCKIDWRSEMERHRNKERERERKRTWSRGQIEFNEEINNRYLAKYHNILYTLALPTQRTTGSWKLLCWGVSQSHFSDRNLQKSRKTWQAEPVEE